jgi:ferredoxin
MAQLRYIEEPITLALDCTLCNDCGLCVDVCPRGCFAMDGRRVALVDRGACLECGACALNCTRGAITVEAGVGCAAAIIKGWVTGSEPSCDCG